VLRETGTKLKASYGTAAKAPTIFELFGFSSTFQGNPDLVPERSHGWDAGIEQSLLAGRAAVEATYFDLRIDNLIAGFGNTARNLPGESRTHGIELSGRYAPTDSLDLVASYTYTGTRDSDGNEFVRQPKHVASFTGTYRFLEGRASTTLGIDYHGDTRDLAFFPFPEPPQRVVLAGYTLVRLAASYRPTDWLQIFGRIENALDTQYEETFSFATPGRAGYVGIKATF
jgi:vitamin B12 transporter